MIRPPRQKRSACPRQTPTPDFTCPHPALLPQAEGTPGSSCRDPQSCPAGHGGLYNASTDFAGGVSLASHDDSIGPGYQYGIRHYSPRTRQGISSGFGVLSCSIANGIRMRCVKRNRGLSDLACREAQGLHLQAKAAALRRVRGGMAGCHPARTGRAFRETARRCPRRRSPPP